MNIVLFTLIAALPPGMDPALLPGVETRKPAEIELAGLAALYPGRVLTAPPRLKDERNAGRQPKVVDLPRKITYARIYDLELSVPKISELLAKPALILDLRYVTEDVGAAKALAKVLMQAGLTASPVRALGDIKEPAEPPAVEAVTHPPPLVLVLVNHETSGPLEAWLAAFQDKESIFTVGTSTGGQPGHYRAAEGVAGYYILTGELQPASGSVAGTGLKPRFPVEIKPEQNFLAYQSFENGVDPAHLLRREPAMVVAPPATSGNATPGNTTAKPLLPAAPVEDEITDPVLQRAVDVVAALQVLGRVPSSPVPDATKTPAARPSPVSTPNPPPTQR